MPLFKPMFLKPHFPAVPPVLVNDTLTGDPLMTVPILTDEDVAPGDEIISLCYEVHGQADYVFNLVSDTCVTVNAHYAKAPINSPNIDLNVVDAIGVRAVSDGGTCENIRVGLQGCQATVNGVDVNGMYRRDNISVREYANRVRIVVPNCADTDLVMWVFCTNGQTEDPVTWEFFDFDFIRFVVRRGLNLAEESHGLIGKVFLNMNLYSIFCVSHIQISIHSFRSILECSRRSYEIYRRF